MKSVLLLTTLLASSLATARPVKKDCSFNSNNELQLTISFEGTNILGASLYNTNWSETAKANYQPAATSTSMDSSLYVGLQDGQTLEIPLTVLRGGSGTVLVNNSGEYSCQ